LTLYIKSGTILDNKTKEQNDMTVTTVKAAIALLHEPEIDSLWEYEDAFGQPLWAAFIHGQYCDIYGSSTALKHDGEITGMGRDFLDTHKSRKDAADEINYPISPETKRWWEGRYKE
jgi:hypothetical protein